MAHLRILLQLRSCQRRRCGSASPVETRHEAKRRDRWRGRHAARSKVWPVTACSAAPVASGSGERRSIRRCDARRKAGAHLLLEELEALLLLLVVDEVRYVDV